MYSTCLFCNGPLGTNERIEQLPIESLERPAVEGHLIALEQAWREAEEIAAISDNMFLPSSIDDELSRMRTRGAGWRG